MLAINCCKTMEAELTAWKANVYDSLSKLRLTAEEAMRGLGAGNFGG